MRGREGTAGKASGGNARKQLSLPQRCSHLRGNEMAVTEKGLLLSLKRDQGAHSVTKPSQEENTHAQHCCFWPSEARLSNHFLVIKVARQLSIHRAQFSITHSVRIKLMGVVNTYLGTHHENY